MRNTTERNMATISGWTDDPLHDKLCNLIHPNHSKEFWQVVGRFDTDYLGHRQWLKEKGSGLL